jgi:hypothetical protein
MARSAGRDEKGEHMGRVFKQSVTVDEGGLGLSSLDGGEAQAMMFLERWYHPAAIDDDWVLTTTALPTAAAGSDPTPTHTALDFPRNVTVVASAAATSVVTVTGTREGATQSEALTLTGTATVTGSKIFDVITGVHFAQQIDGAANIKVGIGNKLGLARTPIAFLPEGLVDNALESTVPTLDLTNHSVAFNTALAATKVYVLKYWSSEYK